MKTTTATLASIAVAGALTVAAPLSPVSSLAVSPAHAGGETNLRKIHRLQRAGARRGAYCAFYKGRNTFDEFPLAQSFSQTVVLPDGECLQVLVLQGPVGLPDHEPSQALPSHELTRPGFPERPGRKGSTGSAQLVPQGFLKNVPGARFCAPRSQDRQADRLEKQRRSRMTSWAPDPEPNFEPA